MSNGLCRLNWKRAWRCKRREWHTGPCALVPRWWNLRDRWIMR